MRAFVVLGVVFFHSKPRDWLGETSVKLPILCRVGRKTTIHNQSINQQVNFKNCSESCMLFNLNFVCLRPSD